MIDVFVLAGGLVKTGGEYCEWLEKIQKISKYKWFNSERMWYIFVFAGFCFVVKCEKDLQFNPHPNRYWQLRRGSNAWDDGTCCNLEPKNIREALGAHKQKDVLKQKMMLCI